MATYTITGFVLDDDTLNFKDTTYGDATVSESGLMSSTDKGNLDDAVQDITTMQAQIDALNNMIKRAVVSKSVSINAMSEIKFCNYSDVASDCAYNKVIGITPQNIQNGSNTVINVLAYSDGIYIDNAAAFTNRTISLLVTYATVALPTTTKAL